MGVAILRECAPEETLSKARFQVFAQSNEASDFAEVLLKNSHKGLGQKPLSPSQTLL